MSEELVKQEGSKEVAQYQGAVPFATAGSITDSEQAAKIMSAKKLDFNTAATTWSPEENGERKRLVFQGVIEGAQVKNKFKQSESDPDYVYKDKAVFVEMYQEGDKIKQRVIESYATHLISYLRSNQVPRHAILDIEYDGKRKGEKFHYDVFKIMPVPVTFE